MKPQVEHSPYHLSRPLARDLAYHIENGTPVLDSPEEPSETA